jgi:glutathione S-transferase
MSEDLVFYTHPMSRGRVVRWMLEELGRPYTTHVVDYGPKMKSADYLAINPMGKVPALQHRGEVVTECAAICAYLADAFPAAGLAPAAADKARAPYLRWLFFAAGPLEAASALKMLDVTVPKEKLGFVGCGTLDDVIAALEGAVRDREFIAGNRFSAADVYIGSHLIWGMQMGGIPKRAAFERYCKGLVSRPAAIRARALDDALVPAHPIPGMPT